MVKAAMRVPIAQAVDGNAEWAIERGELMSDILQAVCRINVRYCNKDQAPRADVYVMASNNAGFAIAPLLAELFPGCSVIEANGGNVRALSPKAEKALAFLADRKTANQYVLATFKETRDHIGERHKSGFAQMRRGKGFEKGLIDLGVLELNGRFVLKIAA
jgi:hypothetical protein